MPVSELFRGHTRMRIIRDIAMGEWDIASIADREGIDVEDLRLFETHFASDISEVRLALAGQLAIESAGLWIAKRHNRIAEMQADFEDVSTALDQMRKNEYRPTDNEGSNLGSKRHRYLVKARLDILRSVADELSPRNQSTSGDPTDPNIVHYVIDAGPLKDALT